MHEINQTLRVLPIHVIDPRTNKESSIHIGEELESLISTFGGEIVDRVIQKMIRPVNATYIGKGKIEEVIEIIEKEKVDIVVLNAMAKPGQIYALKNYLEKANPEIEVWDRVDLILQIFDKHASTTEAKLQIELARMRYMGPRIYGMGHILSRQGGGIGTMGIGETNTELMKRHWRNEMKRVTDQLEKLSRNKELQLNRRREVGFKTVSIVGYTNAGKSSLFNVLTGKSNLAQDVLFATLDSSVSKMYIEGLTHEVLISDTIGFIRDLPPVLINAFKSTLLESIHADILLHVIDVADPEVEQKIDVVQHILDELEILQDNTVYIFNKIDCACVDIEILRQKYHEFSPVFISVKENRGLDEIKKIIKNRFLSDISTNTSPSA